MSLPHPRGKNLRQSPMATSTLRRLSLDVGRAGTSHVRRAQSALARTKSIRSSATCRPPAPRSWATLSRPSLVSISSVAALLSAAHQSSSIGTAICLRSPQGNASDRALTVANRRKHQPLAEQTPRTVRELLRAVARAIFLAVLLLPPVILLVPSLAFPSSERWRRAFESALLRALERGGPCLIKLGQWASTRPDVLPLSLCRALGSLHDRVPPHSLEHSVAAIEEAFGVPCEAMFASLSDEPIGSGCVAQVHIATTAPSVEGSVDAAAASAAVAPHGRA